MPYTAGSVAAALIESSSCGSVKKFGLVKYNILPP